MDTIPPRFDLEFIEWFRAATEAGWARARPATLAQRTRAGVGGLGWARGTQWAAGMTEGEIAAVEAEWGFRFPEDHRLFLRHLHCTERPRAGAYFEGTTLKAATGPGVYNWQTEGAALRGVLAGVVDGILFDVEHNALWLGSWGDRPSAEGERAAIVEAEVARAPRLAPIYAHRCVLVDPSEGTHPVLSIHQSDVVLYGADLRSYLLREFADVGGWDFEPDFGAEWAPPRFWGELDDG